MAAAIGSVEYWAGLRPHDIAVVDGERTLTFGDWNAAADRLAQGLAERGVGPGDIVGVRTQIRLEWPIISAAVGKLGARLLVANWRFTADEMAFILENSGAKALIVDDPDPRPVLAAANRLGLSFVAGIEGAPDGVIPFCMLFDDEAPERFARNDPALVVYTSGTTGRPKGVVMPERPPPPTPDAVGGPGAMLITMPMHHGAGPNQVWTGRTTGRLSVLMRRFDAAQVLALIERHRINHWAAVPTMCQRISVLPAPVLARYDVSSIRSLSMGAAPVPFALKQWVVGHFGEGKLSEGYGTTETGMITGLAPADQLTKPGSSGMALKDVDIRIRDADGHDLAPGAEGEIWVKTPTTIHGYLNAPALGPDTCDADGFFKVGDVGRLEADGHLYLTDRSKDMIVSGGVNIYPAEIEAVLADHPQVLAAAVVGVPDDDFGETPIAFLEMRPGATAQPDEIAAAIHDRLASYKRPKAIHIIDELPRNLMGKVLKTELRAPYWKGRDRRI
ncbi:MAG: AMP-binding protein [Alphaproteobacteria bacterium]|nr:AMP-binding protein [Alphaproteobacteria bacterium]MBU1515351.1 AMP-binding protein [Alphaproteobacteria bacterium]MBU2095401.1 AMP-binding protein [Alphaproteobacteria bacterium]MBU2152579.1 AMP-binding protein [Alphaproteobacteria bacterium]MBU2309975.1 AMP-binding protein [Alphaproteobacteria bacterium]